MTPGSPESAEHDAASSIEDDQQSSAPAGDELVDEMSEESFPTSDPPSTWAGADRPPRESDD